MGLKDEFIKKASLVFLVVQNTALVLLLRYSRMGEGPKYISSTAVACMESLKLFSCFTILFVQSNFSFKQFSQLIYNNTLGAPFELVKLAIPSILYLLQNNLLYFALSHLDAATYQVCYQTKILTTAVFSMIMLGKQLYPSQWLALFILASGVVLAELSSQQEGEKGESDNDATDNTGDSNTYSLSFWGFIAVLIASCTSAFSGVYFEKVLKGSQTSLWVRNIQMGLSSTFIGFVLAFLKDGSTIQEKGFFFGYSYEVLGVIFLQAVGGLTVAVVVKYADNILKGFAASFSIVCSVILEAWFMGFQVTVLFIMGTCLVILSSWMYGRQKPKLVSKLKEDDEEDRKMLMMKGREEESLSSSKTTPSTSSTSTTRKKAMSGNSSSGMEDSDTYTTLLSEEDENRQQQQHHRGGIVDIEQGTSSQQEVIDHLSSSHILSTSSLLHNHQHPNES